MGITPNRKEHEMSAEDNMAAYSIRTPSVDRLARAASYAVGIRNLYNVNRTDRFFAKIAENTFALNADETKAVAAMLKAIPHQPTATRALDEAMTEIRKTV